MKKLAQGAYTFDTVGKPMLVKKRNPAKLPGMLTESAISVEGVKIRKPAADESTMGLTGRSLKAGAESLNVKSGDLTKRIGKVAMRVRPVTATVNNKKKVIKKNISSAVMLRNEEFKQKLN